MNAPVIQCERLSFGYGQQNLLEDVDLAIPSRDFVSMVGPNGSGKTTLLKLFLGLLSPSHGKIRIFGTSCAQARQRIGYVPQHPRLDPLFPLSVMDVTLMGRLGRTPTLGPYRGRDRRIAREALMEVGLQDMPDHAFASLSGGQKQRVLIARALACRPELLLLDEPTASLDVHIEEEFYELLKRLNERLTVVLVSHDLGFVSQYVKSVICVKKHVVIHPTSEITGEIINALYGSEVRMVRHDQRCSEEGHQWPNS